MPVKPFLKWAGSKYRVLEKIIAVLPEGKRLIEPFAGSAAVSLNTHYEDYFIADANHDLINLFFYLRQDHERFIAEARKLFEPLYNQASAFYAVRNEFNTTTDLRRKAILFIYLNRHCFNGLCRYNAIGEFNVPFGRYIKPYFPEVELRLFLSRMHSAEFRCAGFIDTLQQARRGDVVYCDPPYVPLSTTANFTHYTQTGFTLRDQRHLVEMALQLRDQGIPVIISNHDTPLTRELYADARIIYFDVRRVISCDVKKRGVAGELLAIFE